MKYVLRNKNDFEITLLSFGATIQSMKTKDRNKKSTNVVLGFNTLEEYADQKLNPYFGGIIGRVTNRISNAQFKLDGKTFNLEKNDGNNTLHGGKSGYNWVSFKTIIFLNQHNLFINFINREIGDQPFLKMGSNLTLKVNQVMVVFQALLKLVSLID